MRAHKEIRAVLGEEPTRNYGVTNILFVAFYIFKITNKKRKRGGIYDESPRVLYRNKTKTIYGTISKENVYFFIHK